MIPVNLVAVSVCGVVSMVLGMIWYGPLFGKKWTQIIGATAMDLERRKEMQKRAMPLYVISFVLTLVQAYILAMLIGPAGLSVRTGVIVSLLMWLGFVIPTVAAGAMWNNDSAKISWARFLIQAGYYLVLFIIFGLILSSWQ